MPEKNVITVVLVAIKKEDKILLLKREKEPLKGYWGMIGGKLKVEESIEDAVVRETKEETGLDVEFKGIKGVLHERLFEKETVKNAFLLVVVEATPKTFELIHSHEGEVRWFDLENIESEKVILSDLWMIKNILPQKTTVYKGIMREENETLSGMNIERY